MGLPIFRGLLKCVAKKMECCSPEKPFLEVGELVLALVEEETCSGFLVMQSACIAGGAKRGCGPWSKLGDPAYWFLGCFCLPS